MEGVPKGLAYWCTLAYSSVVVFASESNTNLGGFQLGNP